MAKRYERQPKIDCTACGHWDTLVTDGWPDERGRGYIRRRRCQKCQAQFHTVEILDTLQKRTISSKKVSLTS